MTVNDTASSQSGNGIVIGQADLTILLAVNRYHYLTAAQVSRLLYPASRDQNRYSQRRLKRLTDAGYLLRLRDLPALRLEHSCHVFTLARAGRELLAAVGVEVALYYRPSEEREKALHRLFMEHTLAVVDVLIAAERLTASHAVTCPRLLTERQLKQMAVRVEVPAAGREAARKTTVIPDSWFQLQPAGQGAFSISLEVDRGTTDQKAWRRKVAALASWSQGPYRQVFETDNVTIAVTTQSAQRRDKLREWTKLELASRSQDRLADLFLFTASDPVGTSPVEFFFGPVWYSAADDRAVSLLDGMPAEQRELPAARGRVARGAGEVFISGP